ncbi:MAG: phage tail tube protein [Betaproteobacteria bacterium]
MSNAISAFGTLLKIGDGATPTENFTTIAEVTNISGPGFALETAEATSHSSPGGWREYIATLLDAGEVTFDINFLPTDPTHGYSTGLLRDMVNRTKRNFKLVFPDASNTTWTFAAFVTGFEPSEPIDDKLSASVTLKITGQPILA